jgi:hypothetical protein
MAWLSLYQATLMIFSGFATVDCDGRLELSKTIPQISSSVVGFDGKTSFGVHGQVSR